MNRIIICAVSACHANGHHCFCDEYASTFLKGYLWCGDTLFFLLHAAGTEDGRGRTKTKQNPPTPKFNLPLVHGSPRSGCPPVNSPVEQVPRLRQPLVLVDDGEEAQLLESLLLKGNADGHFSCKFKCALETCAT